MLLLPNDMGRNGRRTTEFWMCAAAEAVLLGACLLSDGAAAGGAAVGAAVVAAGYCACRTALKIRAASAGGQAVERAMEAARDKPED